MSKFINKIFTILLLVILGLNICSCNFKKPRVKPLAYEGSVMLYSSLTEEESQIVKEAFEAACPGITLDYYFGTDEEVKNKFLSEKDANKVSADIILTKDIKWIQSNKNLWYAYEPYDARKIKKEYKDLDNTYVPVAMLKEDSDTNPKFIYAVVVKGAISENNATYLIDYLLSTEGQKLMKSLGYLSVNSKNK